MLSLFYKVEDFEGRKNGGRPRFLFSLNYIHWWQGSFVYVCQTDCRASHEEPIGKSFLTTDCSKDFFFPNFA